MGCHREDFIAQWQPEAIFPPGYLGSFYFRDLHLCLLRCVLQRQGNHRFKSSVLGLTKILLICLGTWDRFP